MLIFRLRVICKDFGKNCLLSVGKMVGRASSVDFRKKMLTQHQLWLRVALLGHCGRTGPFGPAVAETVAELPFRATVAEWPYRATVAKAAPSGQLSKILM